MFSSCFWLLALFVPFRLELEPVAFGLIWTPAILTIGLRPRRLGKSIEYNERRWLS